MKLCPKHPELNGRRYANNNACVACQLARNKAWKLRNTERVKTVDAAWVKNNPEKRAATHKRWQEKDVEKARAVWRRVAAKQRAAKPELIKQRKRVYQQQNPSVINAAVARRKAAKLRATPAWADHAKIQEFYFAADFLGMVTGEWHHVDHIVPLQSKKVCGLHVEHNLQVLPGVENTSKGNRWWPGATA